MSDEDRLVSHQPDQLFYPSDMLDDLANQLGAKPSCGARVLHMLTELTDAEITMFGFDFKITPSFYRWKDKRGPHNWMREREYALSLIERGRVKMVS